VLGVEHVDTNADFFDVGGTSLSLMRLLAQINGRFGTQLGIDAVADGVTVANLTSVVFGSHPSI
jgi:acyl carrier protein